MENQKSNLNNFEKIMLVSFLLALVSLALLLIVQQTVFAIFLCIFTATAFICSIISNQIKAKQKKESSINENVVSTSKENVVAISDERKKQLDKLADLIKEKTEMESYKIKLTQTENTGIYESKLGGIPYWDLSKEYPTDSKGNKLILLAQINFEKENFNDSRLPNKGMVQFFIACDDLYGADLDNYGEQIDWRIIFHEEIKENIDINEILKLNIKTSSTLNQKEDEYFPFYKEYLMEFIKVKSYMGIEDYKFEQIAKDILKSKFNENVETTLYRHLKADCYSYLANQFEPFGHKLLGYPDFTQTDPREYNQYYDTLLLQIDTEGEIMWGDSGVCNFFINKGDLEKKDFSKVLYNWDCY